MKKFFLPLIAVFALSACSSDDDAALVETPLVITKADCETNYIPGGETFNFSGVSPSDVSIPIAGEDQTWDFSTLDELDSTINGGSEFFVPSDPAFPTATYAEEVTAFYRISGVDSNIYNAIRFTELNDNGLFSLGTTQIEPASINVAAIGAVLEYAPQTKNFTGTIRRPSILFPAQFGDAPITTSGIELTSSFTVTAPAFGLNNVPGQTVLTTDVTQEVIASGTANFKGIGIKRVLVSKTEITETMNYFLGGAPASPELLALLGATDGEMRSSTTYRFIAEGLGSSGFIEVDESGTITRARFRKE